jgi:hypothetical protein
MYQTHSSVANIYYHVVMLVLEHIRLSLSTESASHLLVFFSHYKSANNAFSYYFSAKRTYRADVP